MSCTHSIIYCFTVHSLERCFFGMFIVLSFFSPIHVCTGIRGLTIEALNIRGNQVGVFFLRGTLKAEVVGSEQLLTGYTTARDPEKSAAEGTMTVEVPQTLL